MILFDQRFQELTNFNIHLNYELMNMFGFVCDPSKIYKDYYCPQLNYSYMGQYNNMFYISEIQRPLNSIFPFVKCVVNTNLNIIPLNFVMHNTSEQFQLQPVQFQSLVTDFDFQIGVPDDFYNSISYVAPNFDRKIQILSNNTPYIIFEARVITPDGYSVNIRQKRGSYSNIFLVFIPN